MCLNFHGTLFRKSLRKLLLEILKIIELSKEKFSFEASVTN